MNLDIDEITDKVVHHKGNDSVMLMRIMLQFLEDGEHSRKEIVEVISAVARRLDFPDPGRFIAITQDLAFSRASDPEYWADLNERYGEEWQRID